MEIDKILDSGLINMAALSRILWPDTKGSKVRLAHKIAKRAGQRLTETDRKAIEQIFKGLFLEQ